MFDYMFLKIVWWLIIGFILIVYAATAGFDLGVTMLMPWLRNEEDRRIVLNTSAPTWDGNQTWIVFAGGGLFVVYPVLYSTAFSGLYAAMLLILWPFCLRPPGYDYRSKIDNHRWRRMWDVALFFSSFLPVFIFGVIFGNCLLGLPYYFDPISLRVFYTGNFFDLLSGFGILSGFVSVFMLLSHGACYVQRRTEGHIRQHFKKLHLIFSIIVLILFTICGYIVANHIAGYQLISTPLDATNAPLSDVVSHNMGDWIASYNIYPWKYYPPVLAYLGIIISVIAAYKKAYVTSFWASVFGIGGIIATGGGTLFPFIFPSSTNPNQSITVWNGVSSQYALNIMLYVGVVLLVIILVYKIFTYYHIWHKQKTLTAKDLKENEHTFY